MFFFTRWIMRTLESGARNPGPTRTRCPRRQPSFRPVFELLEDRTVPSGFLVTDTSDLASDTGSLRYAMVHAASGDSINFASTLSGQTIDLTNIGDNSFGPSAFLVSNQVAIVGPAGGIT